MGQKINANALRITLSKNWKSKWFAEKGEYQEKLHEDIKMRDMVTKRLRIAGLDRVEIARSSNMVTINVYVARPGVAIGRGGEGIDKLKEDLEKRFKKKIDLKINEIKKPEFSARVVARSIAEGLEKKQSPKKLMTTERDKVMQAGAKGVKIWISGDFGVPKQSRTIKISEGEVPLQKLRADVDFARDTAMIRSAGLHGVKVWIHRPSEEDAKESGRTKRTKRK